MSTIPGRDAADDPQDQPGMRAMRASDQDRTEAVMALTDHVTEGRLDSDEFEARVSAAYAATYLHELDPLFLDLPYAVRRAAVADSGASRRRPVGRAGRFGGRRPAFVPLAVLAVIVVVAIATGHLWLLVPVAWFVVMAPHRRRWREHALARAGHPQLPHQRR